MHYGIKTSTTVLSEDKTPYEITDEIYVTSIEAAAAIINILLKDRGIEEIHIDGYDEMNLLYD